MPKSKLIKVDTEFVQKWAGILESTFDEHGLRTKVSEVNLHEKDVEYRLRVIAGLKLKYILELEPDISLAMASPTGHVSIQAPIPGTQFVGITVPTPPDAKPIKEKKMEIVHLTKEVKVTGYTATELVRDLFTLLFRGIGKYSYLLSDKIQDIGKQKVN